MKDRMEDSKDNRSFRIGISSGGKYVIWWS